MENRNTLIALGLYLGIAVVVALALASAFQMYKPALTDTELAAHRLAKSNLDGRQARLSQFPQTPVADAGPSGSSGPDRSRVLELQLAEKSQQLRAALEEMESERAAYADLRRQFDELLSSAVDLLGVEPPLAGGGTVAILPAASGTASADAVEQTRTRLQNELDKAAIVQQGLIDEVERLRRELTRVMDELLAVQAEADQEIRSLLNNELVVQSAATDTLARVGAAAVPSIIDSLHSELPEVRRWAARVLGQMGANANSAKLALTEALLDRDESVRAAARAALDAIERQ